jgi:hypothetical protein
VVFGVANAGPGDAFSVTLPAPGVPDGFELLSIEPASLEVAADDTGLFTVRWSVGHLRGRGFDADVEVPHTDALDESLPALESTLHVTVPS